MSQHKRKYKKKTNVKTVANYAWNPHETERNSPYLYPYHQSFPVPTATTNKDLPITLNKRYNSKLQWKDSYVVICLYP